MSDFVEVLRLADVPEGTVHRVVVDDIPIAVVHTEGEVYAVGDICSHAEVSLSEGEVDGCYLECWLHGARFDVRTGEPSGPPATRPIPTYDLKVEGTGPDAQILVRAR
jgi:3-phenylpropionate/trans-cinnamate dioxygenase ferredoxin component